MKTSDFDYDLPERCIAQEPAPLTSCSVQVAICPEDEREEIGRASCRERVSSPV